MSPLGVSVSNSRSRCACTSLADISAVSNAMTTVSNAITAVSNAITHC